MSIPKYRCFRGLIAGIAALVAGIALGAQPLEIIQAVPRDGRGIKPPSVPSFPGPVIPGLRQGGVPQGIAVDATGKRLLISHYFENAGSRISVLDSTSGKLLACPLLEDLEGNNHQGHVGGIAVLGDKLFAASDGHVYQYQLAPFLAADPPLRVRATAVRKCETSAGFCTATEDMLFVGEFAYGKKYPTRSSHHLKDRKGVRKYAWVCGYKSGDPLGEPDCVLSVRQKVQGMCVFENRIFLSVSYGRGNRSQIVVYRNPMSGPAHRAVLLRSGESVPLWFLDGENFVGAIDFPPMSEGLLMIDDRLAVLSESGAEKYQPGGKGPLDRVLLLDVSGFQTE